MAEPQEVVGKVFLEVLAFLFGPSPSART